MSDDSLSKIKYSYFCNTAERRPCITVAFCEVEDYHIAYGVAVASPSEKQAMYKIGKCIAENRCACAIAGLPSGTMMPWGKYNGDAKVLPYAMSVIQSDSVSLDMFGLLTLDEFREKLQSLRNLMPVGRHKIKDKKK